jgi:transcriptional regulator GlxA family with amidase domain
MDNRVLWAIAELDRRLNEVDHARLAADVNLSLSRFTYLFRVHTGHSPSQYLHALRMERARTLLQRTFLTVKQVMAQVGVVDASHFSRDFRRYHGITPTQARRAVHPRPDTAFALAHLDRLELARDAIARAANFANK